MQKKKDGTVVASLTEVKNKTGDIFDLADEFGEVILTSYNKPRYKLIKLDIADVMDLDGKENKSAPRKVSAHISAESHSEAKVEVPKIESESEHLTTEAFGPQLIDRRINLTPWDRKNSKEMSFVAKSIKSLLN